MDLPLAVRITDGVASLADGLLAMGVGLLLVGVRRPAARLLEAGLFFGLLVVAVSETYRRLGLPLGGHNVLLLAAYPAVARLFLGLSGWVGLAAGLLAMSFMWLGGLLVIGVTALGKIDLAAVMSSWPAYAGLWAMSMTPLAGLGWAAWRRGLVLVDLGGGAPVRRQSLILVNLFLVQIYALLLLGNVAAARHVHFWEAVPSGLSGYLVWLAVVALPVVSIVVLREMQRLLQQEAEARRGRELEQTVRIAATAVHEVIQPLTTVSCRLEFIGGILGEEGQAVGGGEPPAGEEAAALDTRLGLARRWLYDSLRLLQKVEHTGRDFLLLARVTEPEGALSLGEVAREVVHHCRLLAAERGVGISLSVADGVPAVKGRPGHLEQLVRNLVVNALEACEPGGLVWVGVRGEGEHVILEVSDNGCGVPPHLRQRIFEPFFTTKELGTGLGLVVVRQVAASHGARVTVRDREGGGTTFLVTFPAEHGQSTSAA